MMKKQIALGALLLALAGAACSEDAPVADPGGMGAGQPGDAMTREDSARALLEVADQPGMQDSTEAGGESVTGALRDSVTGLSGRGDRQRPGGVDSVTQAGEPPRRP